MDTNFIYLNNLIGFSNVIRITSIKDTGDGYLCTLYNEVSLRPNHGIQINDILRCERNNNASFLCTVYSVNGNDIIILKDSIKGKGRPYEGDILVKFGNLYDTNRQSIFTIESKDYKSSIKGYNNISDTDNLDTKLSFKIGYLNNIYDADFNNISGVGVYVKNGFISGTLIAKTGSNIYTKDEINSIVDSSISGVIKDWKPVKYTGEINVFYNGSIYYLPPDIETSSNENPSNSNKWIDKLNVTGTGNYTHKHDNLPILDGLNIQYGYLLFNNTKIISGNSDKWDGYVRSNYLNQPVRTVDNVTFNKVITSDANINKIYSNDFNTGIYTGTGFNIDKNNDKYDLEIDTITVRKGINKGYLDYSRGNESLFNLGSFILFTESIKIKDVIDLGSNNYKITIVNNDGKIPQPFIIGDVIINRRDDNPLFYSGNVISLDNNNFSFTMSLNVTYSTSVPKVNDIIIRYGGLNITRSGTTYISTTPSQEYLETVDNVTNNLSTSKIRARLGNLTGIYESDFGNLVGHGLYSDNAYIKGLLFATSGSNIYTKVETDALLKSKTDSITIGVYNYQKDISLSVPSSGSVLSNITPRSFTVTFLKTGATPYVFLPNLPKYNLNENYILTFYIKATLETTDLMTNMSFGIRSTGTSDVAKRINVGEWVKIEEQFNLKTYTSGSSKIIIFTNEYTNGVVYEIADVKLEKGNKASDWSPNFEDIDGKITTVSTNLTNLAIGATNRFVANTVTVGNYLNHTTGAISTSATHTVSDFIPVTANINYILSGLALRDIRIASFNASKVLITGSGVIHSGLVGTSKIYKTAVGASFVRFSSLHTSNPTSTWKFEKGNRATDWSPSPEDVDFKISTLAGNVYTKVETDGKIKEKVDSIAIGTKNYISVKGSYPYTSYSTLVKEIINPLHPREGIKFTYKRVSTKSGILTLAVTNFMPSNKKYTITGRMLLNDVPITKSAFSGGKASSYNYGETNERFDVDSNGNFVITETYGGISAWLFHVPIIGWEVDGIIVIENLKFEEGNKPSDFTISPEDVNNKIDIVTVRTEPDAIKDVVKSQTEIIANTASTVTLPNGKMLYKDPSFDLGANTINIYPSSTGTTMTRITNLIGNPTTNTIGYKFVHTGMADVNRCSLFRFTNPSRANAVFITRIIAKLPIGWSIMDTHNAHGTGGNRSEIWLTPTLGTGKWEEYVLKVVCGDTGTFLTINHFDLRKNDANTITPTPEAPIESNLAWATVYDMSDVLDIPTINDMNISINTAVNTSKTYVDTQIESFQIGTVNILNNSGDFRTAQGWYIYTTSTIAYRTNNTIRMTATGNNARVATLSRIQLWATEEFLTITLNYNATSFIPKFGGKMLNSTGSESTVFDATKISEIDDNGTRKSVFRYKTPVRSATNDRIFFYISLDPSQSIDLINIKIEKGIKSTEWTPSVSDNINNITIGGVNILTDSRLKRQVLYGGASIGNITINEGSPSNSVRVTKTTSTSGIVGFQHGVNDRNMVINSGDTYTLSFDYMGTFPNLNYVYLMRNDGANHSLVLSLNFPTTVNSTEYTRISFSFVAPWSSNSSYLMFSQNIIESGWFDIKNIKLERGLKGTDYSLSPIDINSTFNDIDYKIDNLIAKKLSTGLAPRTTIGIQPIGGADPTTGASFEADGIRQYYKISGRVASYIGIVTNYSYISDSVTKVINGWSIVHFKDEVNSPVSFYLNDSNLNDGTRFLVV